MLGFYFLGIFSFIFIIEEVPQAGSLCVSIIIISCRFSGVESLKNAINWSIVSTQLWQYEAERQRSKQAVNAGLWQGDIPDLSAISHRTRGLEFSEPWRRPELDWKAYLGTAGWRFKRRWHRRLRGGVPHKPLTLKVVVDLFKELPEACPSSSEVSRSMDYRGWVGLGSMEICVICDMVRLGSMELCIIYKMDEMGVHAALCYL